MRIPSPFTPTAALAIVVCLSSTAVNAQLVAGSIFDVTYNANVGGTCSQLGATAINGVVSDAYLLAQAGLQLMADAANNAAATHAQAVRARDAFFRNPTAAQITQITNQFTRVSNWLQGQIASTDNGRNTRTPVFVCGDNDFALGKTMQSQVQALDQHGNVVPALNAQGQPYTLASVPQYAAIDAQYSPHGYQPYFVSRFPGYIWSEVYSQTNPTQFICISEPFTYGVTFAWRGFRFPDTVVLCPLAFQSTAAAYSIALTCVNATLLPQGANAAGTATTTDGAQSKGTTLFHELFHLVLGTGLSVPPNGGEEYGVAEILGMAIRSTTGALMTSADAVLNAESYTLAALSYGNTRNYVSTHGAPVEFYTGVCTFQ